MIEVTDLKQWRYCPRIVWYRYCWPAIRPITDLMQHGIANHQAEEGREARRSLRSYGLEQGERIFDLRVQSERLGLRGRIDLVIITPQRDDPRAEAIIIEYKDSERPPDMHFKLQLTAYALLVEEQLGLPVRRGFFYQIPLRQAIPQPITASLRKSAETNLAAIHQAIQSEAFPAAPANRRPCVSCEFRRFCNDVI